MSSPVIAPTRTCKRCTLTLPVFEFQRRGPLSRVCAECRTVSAQAWRVGGRLAQHSITSRAVDALLALGYVKAARHVLLGAPWPTLREARLMQIPRQRRPA